MTRIRGCGWGEEFFPLAADPPLLVPVLPGVWPGDSGWISCLIRCQFGGGLLTGEVDPPTTLPNHI
jgi:hypothetical protein